MSIFNFFRKKKQPIAIGAIFRNEKEYIIEWLAWHQSQGIENFIIYDNDSDDGTSELLQKIAATGMISYHTIPRQDKAQLAAYEKIIKQYKHKYELIAFVDADEFIMPCDEIAAAVHIENLFKDKSIGALGINWKVFGTNGHQTKPEGTVLSSYSLASSDTRLRNHYIKSVYKPEAVTSIYPHRAVLKKGYRYINADNEDITFCEWENLTPTKNNQTSGVTKIMCKNKLRINHYVLKSVEEFTNKKKRKGGSMRGVNHVLSDGYFKEFDLNDEETSIPHSHMQRFNIKHTELKKRFEH